MKTTKVNESIRIAKEGIGECWDDMAGMTGQIPEGEGEGPMTVTINMPGKNISVTTDSADEIANILKLAGIQIGGMSADGEMPGEMPTEMPGAEEPAVMYVGAEPTVAAGDVPGDNDGDGDHDMHDHEIEHEDSESAEEESAEEESGEEDEVEEATGDKSYTSKGGTVTQTATGLTHQAGSGTYGGTETDSEEKARKDAEQELAKKELPEAVEELDEETARILQLAGVTNEAQSAAQKAAFAKMIAKKSGSDTEDKGEEVEKEEEVEESTTETPAATNSIYGQGVYETSYARILELAGIAESKLMNSPEGTSMSEPTVYDSLPSGNGTGKGRPSYGANRANGQGENPMGDGAHVVTVEEQFKSAMGEYRKFVAESISRKK